jgi:hypothetical protein
MMDVIALGERQAVCCGSEMASDSELVRVLDHVRVGGFEVEHKTKMFRLTFLVVSHGKEGAK